MKADGLLKDEEELMAAVQSGRMNFQGEARNSDNPIYLLPLSTLYPIVSST